jgi:hypothetical protein
MPSKITLALAPVWDSVMPNLAIAFLKGSLQEVGYECRCLDFSIKFRPIMVSVLGDKSAEDYIEQHPDLYKAWAKEICENKPDIIGFSLLVSNLSISRLVAKEVRKLMPNVMIVSGGPSLTKENMSSIETAFEFSNYVIEGEGEKILTEFVQCYEQKGDFTKLKQLLIKGENDTLSYTGHSPLQNIDTIPYPDFTDFDMSLYPCPDRLPMLFSRGCILNCNYCENKWNHLTQRSRGGRNVFDELRHNVDKYNIREYMFNDDSLISSKTMRQLDEYCDLVIAEGLVMPWSVYGTRVERLIIQPFLNKLRRSGMERVSLGVESFSSKIQKEMGKSSRYDDADKMCRMFANEGIRTESWIIYGYPTETDEDFNETLQWFIKNPNVLSHVTANSFGPNAKYMLDRPGVVINLSGTLGDWAGPESTLQKRKERFLLLIEVLESIRVARKGEFSFYFGDPLYVKYFSSWTAKDKEYLLKSWERIENPEQYYLKQNRGLNKVLKFFGMGDKKMAHRVEKAAKKEKLEVGDLHVMQDKFYRRLKGHLAQMDKLTEEERETKLEYYKDYFNQVKLHLNDNVTEDLLFALLLKGPVQVVLADIDMHAPEYIAQLAVEAVANFFIEVVAAN